MTKTRRRSFPQAPSRTVLLELTHRHHRLRVDAAGARSKPDHALTRHALAQARPGTAAARKVGVLPLQLLRAGIQVLHGAGTRCRVHARCPPRTRQHHRDRRAHTPPITSARRFKHILGDYIEALERGRDVLVQISGPLSPGLLRRAARVHPARHRLRRSTCSTSPTLAGKGHRECVKACRKKVNPNLSVAHGVASGSTPRRTMVDRHSTQARDYYLADAGFERRARALRRRV